MKEINRELNKILVISHFYNQSHLIKAKDIKKYLRIWKKNIK